MSKLLIKKNIIEKLKKNKIISNFNANAIYFLHNSFGLGDSLFNLIFFYLIKNYIEQNNIKIFYYAKKEYLNQLKEFIFYKNIFLSSLENKPSTSIELWIANPYFENDFTFYKQPVHYNHYYKTFFNKVLIKLNMNTSINKFFYSDNDLVSRYENIDNKYKNFELLILNSKPLSGQYNYNKTDWDNHIIYLNSIFKVLTTTKVNDLLCTMDDNLTVKDIASLSTKFKVIIAIYSGVVPGLLNEITLKNVKKVYIFDNACYYSYPNFENKNLITDINVDELKSYINC